MDESAIRKLERDAIVAWLRKVQVAHDHQAFRILIHNLTDRIEAGASSTSPSSTKT